MRVRFAVLVALLAAVAAVAAGAGGRGTVGSKPNFIVILADDMGYGDLSCFGRKNISTPHMDSLARDGIKFTQWLSAAPICTPSRAGLLTGRYPHRFGMTANALPARVFYEPSQPTGLPDDEITVAEALRANGYATAMSGKWHLGISSEKEEWQHLPRNHGFDTWIGLPYTNMMKCAPPTPSKIFCLLMANHTLVQQPMRLENVTQELLTHSLDFIETAVAEDRPFFLYHASKHPHTFLQTSKAFVNSSQDGVYGDAVQELDWAVGQILQKLDALGIANNTLVGGGREANNSAFRVLMTSDNGKYSEEGWEFSGRSAGLKGSKGQTYEGGIRVPGLARWPGVIPAGVVTDELVSTLDIFPTLLNLSGAPLPTDRIIDGMNLAPLLRAPATTASPHNVLFHYCGTSVSAVRLGRYKFHFKTANWTSTYRPSPKCVECCPYSVLAFNGTGGTLCDCAGDSVIVHDPPVVYDMTTDKEEQHILTPATLPNFQQLLDQVNAALKAHEASVKPHKSELISLPLPNLQPCCNGHWPFASCECDTYTPHKIYP